MDTSNADRTANKGVVTPVTAREIDDTQRMGTLPRYFGDRMMRFESAVFDWMHRLAPEYRGGFWKFFDLSNGGFYMAPGGKSYRLCVDSNGYEGVMSADAAGITMCLFACSHLSFNDSKHGLFAERFHQLREYAVQHDEAAEILAAID